MLLLKVPSIVTSTLSHVRTKPAFLYGLNFRVATQVSLKTTRMSSIVRAMRAHKTFFAFIAQMSPIVRFVSVRGPTLATAIRTRYS